MMNTYIISLKVHCLLSLDTSLRLCVVRAVSGVINVYLKHAACRAVPFCARNMLCRRSMPCRAKADTVLKIVLPRRTAKGEVS
jgi:hypothetical protein